MKLKALLKGIEIPFEVKGSKEVEIRGIASDSRIAAPGFLFLAKKGTSFDGAQFIEEAQRAGAVAFVTDFFNPFLKKTQIIIENPVEIEAILAAKFYSFPSKELLLVGVTGTKGKTTSCYMIYHLLQKMGKVPGLITTVETILGKKQIPSSLTTHGVIYNQRTLKEMLGQNCKSCVMEVSSHGLDQNRVDEMEFDLGVFTNLYPDHLDYHGTMEEYAKAKQKLFRRAKTSILNRDSPYFEMMRENRKVLSFGIETKADLFAQKIELTEKGMDLTLNLGGGIYHLKTPLLGKFNVYNLLSAIGVGIELNFSIDATLKALSSFQSSPGRLEKVPNNLGIQLFVDFAHSGEALENVLKTLKEIAPKRVIVVFGAGGDRPKLRRKTLALAAEKWADLSIITSDNPRTEDPNQIIEEILSFYKAPQKALIEPDRKKAIFLAVQEALEGDFILIAGKGHEKGQIFARQTIPFDDVSVAKDALLCQSSLT